MRKTNVFLLTAFSVLAFAFSNGRAEEVCGSKSGSVEAYEFKVSLKVSGPSVEDSFFFGMREKATDGFDNAYDAFALRSMNQKYVYTYMPHPEWRALENDFRGDIRSVGGYKEWNVYVKTNLAARTALKMSLIKEESKIPEGYKIAFKDMGTGRTIDIKNLPYAFAVPAGGVQKNFKFFIQKVGAQTYSVSGIVTSKDGSPLPGTAVAIKSDNFVKETIADASGGFSFGDVSPDSYTLSASKEGYKFWPIIANVSNGDVSVDIIGMTSKDTDDGGDDEKGGTRRRQ